MSAEIKNLSPSMSGVISMTSHKSPSDRTHGSSHSFCRSFEKDWDWKLCGMEQETF